MQFTESFTDITAKFFSKLEKNVNIQFLSELLEKLFNELKNGNSYLELNINELKQISKYKNIIQYNKLAPLVIVDNNKLSIGKIWYMERQIANFFISKINHNIKLNNIDTLNKKTLDELNLIIITGAAGTGKTFNIANILNILLEDKNIPKISISATTGKAAINITQSLLKQYKNKPNLFKLNNIKGKTLHKLLNINPYSLKSPQKENINYDLIIIDESSMIDITCMYKLTQLINNKTKLILLGDPNQLPSVGSFDLLSVLIESNLLKNNTINLTKNYRYKKNNGIEKLANLCFYHGNLESKIIHCFSQYPKDIKIIQSCDFDSLTSKWYQDNYDYWQSIKNNDKTTAFQLLYKQILLCALKKDVDQFNQLYLDLIKIKQNIPIHKNIFPGIIIVITQNNYNLNLYNGDIGIVFEENKKLYVYFNEDDVLKHFNINEITDNYDLAFALTVHKSQGCEYDHVTLLDPNYINNSAEQIDIFDKKLIYTAITRAKKTFTYLGDINNMTQAISRKNVKKSLMELFLNTNQKNI